MRTHVAILCLIALSACGGQSSPAGGENPPPPLADGGTAPPPPSAPVTLPANRPVPTTLPFLQLVDGSYPGSCGGQPGVSSVAAGVLAVPGASVDATGAGVSLQLDVTNAKIHDYDRLAVGLAGQSDQGKFGASWSLDGALDLFQVFVSNDAANTCYGDASQPASRFAAPVDIGKPVAALFGAGYQQLFPDVTCMDFDTKQYVPSLLLSISAGQIKLGATVIDLTAPRAFEMVQVGPQDVPGAYGTKEPHLTYVAHYLDGSNLLFNYGSVGGFEFISYDAAGSGSGPRHVTCNP